jgi:hypothetical protein
MQVFTGLGCVMNESFLFSGNSNQNTKVEKMMANSDELAPFVVRFKFETEAKCIQCRFGSQSQQPVAQNAKRDLWVGAFKYGARQAEQHIATAIVIRESSRGIEKIGRAFEKSGTIPFHVKDPSGLTSKPLPKILGMPPHRGELGMRGGHQRGHQQGAQRGRELLPQVLNLMQSNVLSPNARRSCVDPFTSRSFVTTHPEPAIHLSPRSRSR